MMFRIFAFVPLVEEIITDLTLTPINSGMKIFRPNIFQTVFEGYYKACALEKVPPDGNIVMKEKCYVQVEQDPYDRATTIAHELSHSLGYRHRLNQREGMETTVPYTVDRAFEACKAVYKHDPAEGN